MSTENSTENSADDSASTTPRIVIGVVVALLTVVILGCAAWTVRDVVRLHHDDQHRTAALAEGRAAAVAFTSYDYRHIGKDLDRVGNQSTGTFRDRFTKALGALSAAIKKAHGVSRGTLLQAGIVRSTPTTAVVIAAVDARITNTSLRAPSTRRYRLQITLDRVDSDWLISDISPVA